MQPLMSPPWPDEPALSFEKTLTFTTTGMMVATDGNAKTTAAAAGNKKTGKKGSLNDGLSVAFATGAVMGFAVVGLGLTGVTVCYMVLSSQIPGGFAAAKTMQCLAGFGFGASSIALFARVAGGIYTKAADVGADLVGKVEAGIDEDDPHNPAVIADNVGDNVGDVAGMGADLFESYVGSLIAAATLAVSQSKLAGSVIEGQAEEAIALAFLLPAIGILASIVGFFFVSTKEEGKGWDVSLGALMFALEKGMYVAGGLFVALAYVGTVVYLGMSINIWYCVIIGLLAGIIIGKFTEYFTSFDFGPVISIKDRGMTGPATVVIQGLGVGMISCVPPTIVLGVAIVGTATLGGSYGVAISAVGMLSTLGITLATDAYGPVADNAGGLAEMAELPEDVRQVRPSKRSSRRLLHLSSGAALSPQTSRRSPPRAARATDHRRPRRAWQHHRGHRQGLRHRCVRPWPPRHGPSPECCTAHPSTKSTRLLAMQRASARPACTPVFPVYYFVRTIDFVHGDSIYAFFLLFNSSLITCLPVSCCGSSIRAE